MTKITKEMGIIEIVQAHPETLEIFLACGMGCFGCSIAHFETLEQGAMAHGIDPDELVDELNEFIAEIESMAPGDAPALAAEN